MNDSAGPKEALNCTCCVAGGGPAGMMLGYLLARAGVDVIVLEKHADFLRDFRGDTIHPSTLEIMHELGVLEAFLKLPHQELTHLDAQIGDTLVTIADFSRLPTTCKFLAFMPQWDFLNFLVEQAQRYSTFRLLMEAEITDLIQSNNHVKGLVATTPRGALRVEADLVVGADGRNSIVREKARLEVVDFGAPMDALWMRVSKRSSDPGQTLGRIVAGKIFVSLDRGDYWQCAYVIPKGAIEGIRSRGLPAFRQDMAEVAPFLRERVSEVRSWDDIKLLTVKVDRLREWHRPGLLCIGDAAHAMSPIGGVGINLAVQDAVAGANALAAPLKQGNVSGAHLGAVQRRREFPTHMTQRMQLFLQNRGISRVLASSDGRFTLPLPFRLLRAFPSLRGIPARLVGLGFRPEHVKTSDVGASNLL